MAKWFRALDLEPGDIWLKSFALPLSKKRFSLAPSSPPRPRCFNVNSQLISLQPVEFMFYFKYLFIDLQCPQLAHLI